jgi:hypothetical protein
MIVLTAFEIPYGLFVGWENTALEKAFDLSFSIIFIIDVVVNLRTARPKSFAGLWGWRHVARWHDRKFSPTAERNRLGERERTLTEPREIAVDYLKSIWFLIDVVSAIPWWAFTPSGSLLNICRILRFTRITRFLRVMRFGKVFRLIDYFRKHVGSFPAAKRLIASILVMPWLAHIHACVYYYAEHDNPASKITNYRGALHAVFVTFTTNDQAPAMTELGFWTGVSAVVVAFAFISTMIGNVSALFTNMDSDVTRRTSPTHRGHSLVLGWNNTIYAIVDQLLSGDEGEDHHVVILAEGNEEEMRRSIGERCQRGHASFEIVAGSHASEKNLRALNAHLASDIIVIGQEPRSLRDLDAHTCDPLNVYRESDVSVLRGIIACCRAIRAGWEAEEAGGAKLPKVPVVAAVSSEYAETMFSHGIPASLSACIKLQVVNTSDMLARCIAQMINDPRLMRVFDTMFSYDVPTASGDGEESSELYMVALDPSLVGRAFDEVSRSFPEAIVIGYLRGQACRVNPSRDDVLGAEDRLVVLAYRGTYLKLTASRSAARTDTPVPAERPARRAAKARPPRSVLVVGRGEKTKKILEQLAYFLPPHSVVMTEEDVRPLCELNGGGIEYRSIDIDMIKKTIIEAHKGVRDSSAPEQHDMVAASDTIAFIADSMDKSSHDAWTLMTLAALSSITHGKVEQKVILELVDPASSEGVESFGNPVAVISEELVNKYLVQLARSSERGVVVKELLDPSGNEIYIRELSYFLGDGESARPISFEEIMARARGLGEIAIGYCPRDDPRALVLCPVGDDRTKARRPDELGSIVVVAEEW